MRIEDLLWDAANIAHIARHQVEAYEVEEAIWGDPHVRRGRGKGVTVYTVRQRPGAIFSS